MGRLTMWPGPNRVQRITCTHNTRPDLSRRQCPACFDLSNGTKIVLYIAASFLFLS
jgi:hypothetical protein